MREGSGRYPPTRTKMAQWRTWGESGWLHINIHQRAECRAPFARAAVFSQSPPPPARLPLACSPPRLQRDSAPCSAHTYLDFKDKTGIWRDVPRRAALSSIRFMRRYVDRPHLPLLRDESVSGRKLVTTTPHHAAGPQCTEAGKGRPVGCLPACRGIPGPSRR